MSQSLKNATLEFNAKPGGGQLNNDTVNLYNGGGTLLYQAFLSALSSSTWLSPGVGASAFSINVTNFLNLNNVQSLDAAIQDDTIVDFFRLRLEVPERSSLILVAVALSGLAGSLRRHKNTLE